MTNKRSGQNTVNVLRFICGWLFVAATSAFAATITVNSTADVIANDGQCTLREAIIAANTNLPSGAAPGECAAGEPLPAIDTIVFNIAGAGTKTIAVSSSLPPIVQFVVIDGGNGGVANNRVQLSGGGSVSTGLDLQGPATGSSAIRNMVINGFTSDQIVAFNTDGLAIENNIIGLDPTGSASVAGSGTGINLAITTATIGDGSAAGRNLIGSAASDAIAVLPASSVTIRGNYVGLNAAGTARLGTVSHGIVVVNAEATIGGTVAGQGNVIAANVGIVFLGNPAFVGSTGLVQGNLIGTDATGTLALNRLGLGHYGVQVDHAHDVVINGGNVISGNDVGVLIANNRITTGSTALNTVVQGNLIGTAADGLTALGNVTAGIDVFSTQGHMIGGTNAGDGNIIAFNTGPGIRLGGGSTGIAILANSIHSNGALGIALTNTGTPAPNDLGDPDTGSNNLQNYPVLTTAHPSGANVLISGSLNSAPNTTFRVEFFGNSACDASGNGEGRKFLGFTDLTSDALGNVSFTDLSFPAKGAMITATATVKTGPATFTDTSEFSACVRAFNLDVDLDGNADALTDGLLAIRWMFRISGLPLTSNATAPNAQRTDPDDVAQYLESMGLSLDIDDDGNVDALTDGLLMLRYLFLIRGEALTVGATAANGHRTSFTDIQNYLQTLMP
jgi:CSLREA domain-containing protein